MSSMTPPSGGQEQMLRSPTNTNPFPNMARNRDQLDMLWRHIASVLSAGVRERAMAGEQPAEGLTPIRDEKRGQDAGAPQASWERAMGQQLTPLPSQFEEESRMSQGEIGPPELSRDVEQLSDPVTRSSSAISGEEIAQAAFRAGFRGEQLATAVAIAMSESTSNPNAHNPDASTGDDSYGLWQINMLGDLGPERRRRYGLTSNEELWDPDVNARAAYDLVQGRLRRGDPAFQDWSDFKNGRYLRYWDAASAAAAAVEASYSPSERGMS